MEAGERVMGVPLLSLRKGRDNIIWSVPLTEVDEQGDDGPVVRPRYP